MKIKNEHPLLNKFLTNNHRNKPAKDIIKQIINQKGFLGLYKGFWITFNSNFLTNGCYFLTYFSFKDITLEKIKDSSPIFPIVSYAISGGIAGIVYWLVNHPLTTMKTIIQMHDNNQPTLKQSMVIKTLFEEGYLHGVRQLYRGGVASVFNCLFGCMIFYVSYELCKKELEFLKIKI